MSRLYNLSPLLLLLFWTQLHEGLYQCEPASESVCGFCMNLYFIKISSASFNEWLFPLCAVELLKFSVRSCQFCLGRRSTCPTKASPLRICIWIPAAAAPSCRNFSTAFLFWIVPPSQRSHLNYGIAGQQHGLYAINIFYVCITHQIFASDLQRPGNFALDMS